MPKVTPELVRCSNCPACLVSAYRAGAPLTKPLPSGLTVKATAIGYDIARTQDPQRINAVQGPACKADDLVAAVQNRPDSKFRLAVASFKESPDNCIEIITCKPERQQLLLPTRSNPAPL